MIRRLMVFSACTVAVALCVNAANSRPGPLAVVGSAAVNYGWPLAKEIGKTLILDTIIDWGKEKLGFESDNQFKQKVEGQLAQLARQFQTLDERTAKDILQLKDSLGLRPTREEVTQRLRAIQSQFEQRCEEMERKIATLKATTDDLDTRLTRFERLFAGVPRVNVDPLFRTAEPSGELRPHPLVKVWGELLCDSEANLQRLALERKLYKDSAPEIQSLIRDERAILDRTKQFRSNVVCAMGDALVARAQMLETYQEQHRKVRDHDAMIGALAWLFGMSHVEMKGDKYPGRLLVPDTFRGPSCTDILAAFDASGGDVKQFAPIFRALLGRPLDLADNPASAQKSYSTAAAGFVDDVRKSASEVSRLVREARLVRQEHLAAVERFGKLTAQVQALESRKADLLKAARAANERADGLLNAALIDYLAALKRERPGGPNLWAFRNEVLVPAYAIINRTACLDWEDRDRLEQTWTDLCNAAPNYPQYQNVSFDIHNAGVYALTMMPNGKDVASAGDDFTVAVWDALSGRVAKRFTGHRQRVYGLAAAPDGDKIASASWDGTVRVWDVAEGRELWSTDAHAQGALSVAFSPDGRWLATGGLDDALRLWDTQTFQHVQAVNAATAIWSIAFAADGQRLATAGTSKIVAEWSAPKLQRLAVHSGHTDAVFSVAYSPQGQLASCGQDNTVRLWPANAIGKGHTYHARALAYAPNGRTLVSVGFDFTARFWDSSNGEFLMTANRHHGDRIQCVAFTPDGSAIVTGSKDGKVRVWRIPETIRLH